MPLAFVQFIFLCLVCTLLIVYSTVQCCELALSTLAVVFANGDW
jgi:hypothetical protein